MRNIIIVAIIAATGLHIYAADNMFPFIVSYDAPRNITNVSHFLDAPAGKHGFTRIEGETFVNDAGEIRFWGTNLSGTANFPTYEQADRIAARLAKFGYNCVRLHWIDAWDIFGGWNPKNHTDFDPGRVDRIEYLIYALKKQGLYVNVNLHVARWLDDTDGFPHKDQRPTYDKGVGNFYPAMIEKQKEYAKMLLTHVNPYTNLPLTDDPCVAMVEISNEDSIVVEWADNWQGSKISTLPDPYMAELRKQWNTWLKKRYKNTDELNNAWKIVNEPLGNEMLPGGDFAEPVDFQNGKWYLQSDAVCDCDASVVDGVMRIDVRKLGAESYVPQIGFAPFKIEKGVPYTLSLKIRTDKPRRVYTSVSQHHAPWKVNGTSNFIDIDSEWKTFTYKFICNETDESTRFCITGLNQIGSYEIDDITLRQGGNFGFPENCRLEDGTIPILSRNDAERMPNTTRDWFAFLVDVEKNYWVGMYRFLKDELKVKQPISGTQLGYGSSVVQSQLDYCDSHAYWNHPNWPRKQWDVKDWHVRNRALVNAQDLGTLGDLAQRRIAGKPYTISEYNHPYPNQFSGEGLPMLAAFGRFQKWNGVFQYTYAHKVETEPDSLTGYFDLDVHALQLVHSPACAAMFERGDVKEAEFTITHTLTDETELDILSKDLTPQSLKFPLNGKETAINAYLCFCALNVQIDDKISPSDLSRHEFLREKLTHPPTGELRWDTGDTDANAGYFTVDTTSTKLFAGFVKGRTFEFENMKLEIGTTELDFATVSLFRPELREKNVYLLAATGTMRNTNGEPKIWPRENTWDPNDSITLGDKWGTAPVLCEGIPLKLSMKNGGTWQVWPLDTAGNRKSEKPLTFTNGQIELGPEHRTLWYELRY